MCCGATNRQAGKAIKQTDAVQQKIAQSIKQIDTGNPVNNQPAPNSTNVARANEVNRTKYHMTHFGLGR